MFNTYLPEDKVRYNADKYLNKQDYDNYQFLVTIETYLFILANCAYIRMIN